MKKRKLQQDDDDTVDVHTMNNHVYFSGPITAASVFKLNKELREVAHSLRVRQVTHGTDVQPIVLHVTTNGGEIYAAFAVVDCMQALDVDVHSVVEGFVASAGTLISLAATRRFIQPNAYMLVHQLSSCVWGKYQDLVDDMENTKKLVDHMTAFYVRRTGLTVKAVQKLLNSELTWNAAEALDKGLVDEVL